MPLTPQEESQIRKDAEKKYPDVISTGIRTITDGSAILKRQGYISGRSEEREAAKPLVEAITEFLADHDKGYSNSSKTQVYKKLSEALTNYNKK